MALKAYSPAELKQKVEISIDRVGLVKQLNKILLDQAEKAKTGIYIDSSAIDASYELLKELLPDWDVTSGSHYNESYWIIKAK